MLYGKCIFSQYGMPKFKNFMDPPGGTPLVVPFLAYLFTFGL